LEETTGFFLTTALALAFGSDLELRGADLAGFTILGDLGATLFAGLDTLGAGFLAAFEAGALAGGFFATGFFAAGLAAGFLAAFGAGLVDLGFALPGIAGREVCRKKPAVAPGIPRISERLQELLGMEGGTCNALARGAQLQIRRS
jgi:hypothetical protein